MTNKDTKKLNKIFKWIDSVGYTTKFSRGDEVDFDEKVISIRRNQKNIIFSVLHECGHIIGDKKFPIKDCKILEKGYYNASFAKTNLYKYKKLQDEMTAWEEGYKLGKSLGIKIKKDEYDIFAAKNFNTYVKYL